MLIQVLRMVHLTCCGSTNCIYWSFKYEWKPVCQLLFKINITRQQNDGQSVFMFSYLLSHHTWQFIIKHCPSWINAFTTWLPLRGQLIIHCPATLCLCDSFCSLSLFLSGSLSLSYLLGRRRWRSPWPSWPEPWAAPAGWGRSSPLPPARSGTSGSETHKLRTQWQKVETSEINVHSVTRDICWCETEKDQRCQRGKKKWIFGGWGGRNKWKEDQQQVYFIPTQYHGSWQNFSFRIHVEGHEFSSLSVSKSK